MTFYLNLLTDKIDNLYKVEFLGSPVESSDLLNTESFLLSNTHNRQPN